MVVPWSDVSVPYRPVDSDPFFSICLKVQIAPPETVPRPHKRLASGLITFHPVEWFDLVVRMVDITREEVLRILLEVVDRFLNEVLFLVLQAQFVSVIQLPRVLIGGRIVLNMLYKTASFQHERFQTLLRELFCGPASGHARA